MSFEALIQEVYQKVKSEPDDGHLASYIPELATVNPSNFGVHITTVDRLQHGAGDYDTKFSIQSIAKVLSLSLAYGIMDGKLWERVGVEPSGTPFNSLVQLEADKGIPRNPFLNAGALVVVDVLLNILDNAKEEFLSYVRGISDNDDINYSTGIAASERDAGFRNIALCNFIKSFGNIENKPEDVLDFYFDMCSLQMTCKELSNTFLYLADNGSSPFNGKEILNESQSKRINALMQTCGFYDESGEFAFKVGMPGKSGVGGGIIAILPDHYALAVWSPRLNKKGNSYRSMKFLEEFTTRSKLSIF